MPKHVVARVDEIAPGQRKIVEVAGRSIGVFNVKGEYFALRNRCPHQGGPLCEGLLWGLWEAPTPGDIHYSRKGDIRTGQSYCDPAKLRVRAYEVKIEPGEEVVAGRVKGPYVAETYPVEAEGE